MKRKQFHKTVAACEGRCYTSHTPNKQKISDGTNIYQNGIQEYLLGMQQTYFKSLQNLAVVHMQDEQPLCSICTCCGGWGKILYYVMGDYICHQLHNITTAS
jgi:hypothetical protein